MDLHRAAFLLAAVICTAANSKTEVTRHKRFVSLGGKNEDCMHCIGEDYRGNISTTLNGFTCQRWDSQIPHNHGYDPSSHPKMYLEENYCRNPSSDPLPWCYTTDESTRWDYCSIPRCTSPPPPIVPELTCATGKGSAYRGTIAVTVIMSRGPGVTQLTLIPPGSTAAYPAAMLHSAAAHQLLNGDSVYNMLSAVVCLHLTHGPGKSASGGEE